MVAAALTVLVCSGLLDDIEALALDRTAAVLPVKVVEMSEAAAAAAAALLPVVAWLGSLSTAAERTGET